jgi:hypothetical protein
MLDKVRTILAQLDEAQTIQDMNTAGFHLHPLDVELIDYH